MIIKCTLAEYTQLIRSCQRNIVLNECKGCGMENICNNNILEDAVHFEIEDSDPLEVEYVTFDLRE